jgi:S-formylglutathione hydrolase FrmB
MRRNRLVEAVVVVIIAAGTAVVGAGVADAATSSVVAEHWFDTRLVDLTVHSEVNNRDYPVRLLVPAGWSRTAARTWPVLYLLHGGNDDYTSWTRETDIEELSATAQALIVMPEAGRDANYVDWFDLNGGPNAGRWETFHLTEVWSVLQTGYRAGTTRSIAGISSGGTGAFTYAARHPGMFKYAASYSGPMNLNDVLMRHVLMQTATDNGDDPNPNGSWSPVQFGEALVGASNYAMWGKLLFTLLIPSTTDFYPAGTHSWPYWQRELHTSWPRLMGSLGVTVR